MDSLYLPGLRGLFGDWVYYSCLMELSEVAKRVDYAHVLHKSRKLSDQIQRTLERKRAPAISKYLRENKERFFNSLVVGVLGGDPSWFEFGKITPHRKEFDVNDIPEYARHSLGFLCLTGMEEIFALDGQHRLSGIKDAIQKKPELGTEQISTIFVAYKKTEAGFRRGRNLFTTLNRTARAVTKRDVIYLAESDVMAIIARRLVEEHNWFKDGRIALKPNNQLSKADVSALTTIGNLYDVLEKLFLFYSPADKRKESRDELKYSRPEEAKLEQYYKRAERFLELLGATFPEVREFYDASQPKVVVSRHRHEAGGSMLFRPVGLKAMTEVILQLAKDSDLETAFESVSRLPRTLSEVPHSGVLWDPIKHLMILGGPLARRLMLYMVQPDLEHKPEQLLADYGRALGELDLSKVALPTLK